MKHTAKYLNAGFYVVSDKAAGHLVRSLGQKLPKIGWEKFVMLETNGTKLNAWLTRTDTRHSFPECLAKRGWAWAIYALRADAGAYFAPLGKAFRFVPVSTLSVKAA
jgi:hypothetical protein